MKRLILAICLLGTSSAAISATRGVMKIHTPLKLVHTTIFGNKKTIKIPAGQRGVKISTSAGGKLKLEIDGVKKAVKMKLGQRIPSYSGSIHFKAKNIGQPYDLTAKVNTKRVPTDSGSSQRSCTYYINEYICRDICTTPNYDQCHGLSGNRAKKCRRRARRRSCHQSCGYRDVAHYGTEYYDYTNFSVTKNVVLSLKFPSTSKVAATASTSQHSSDTDVYNVSSCRY